MLIIARKGKELKAPYYASAAVIYNDYVIIYNIIITEIDKTSIY
jgi:hypothetical protein